MLNTQSIRPYTFKTHQVMHKPAMCLLAMSIIFANNAHSETTVEPSFDKDSGITEQSEVWGTEISASSLNLQSDTIAIRQADHVSDLLRTIPGVDVGGAHSLNQRITIRSMDDKDIEISIDGARQNTYMYHHMGNLQIHSDILKSVDVEIGTNSVVNGGLGGSVRFETKQAKELLRDDKQFGLRLQGSYANNASESFALTGFGKISDTIDVLAYYNYVDRDDYNVGGGEIEDADGNEVAGTDGKVKGISGELEDALLKFGWDITETQRLSVSYESYSDEGDYSYRPDMGLATDIAIGNKLGLPLTYDTEFSRDTSTLNYQAEISDHTSVKASLYQTNSQLWRDESALHAASAEDPSTIDGEATNEGINIIASSEWGSAIQHTLTYGIDLVKYSTEYSAEGASTGDESAGEEATSRVGFVQDRIDVGFGLAFIPGIRYNDYYIDSNLVDENFSETTAALALEYQPISNTVIKLSSTQLFKGPELSEVFTGAGLGDTANPAIKAETGTNTELAIAFEDDILGAKRFATGITVFQTDIDDFIYDYATPPADIGGYYWKDNIGDMSIQGFEAYVGYDIGQLRMLLTYARAESELSAYNVYADLDGFGMDRQQGDTVSFNLDYLIESTHINLHWDVLMVDDVDTGDFLDSASTDNSKEGYLLNNISASWDPRQVEGLSLIFGIDNVFDEFYASQSSRTGVSSHPFFGDLYLMDYEPGRNVKFTVAYQF